MGNNANALITLIITNNTVLVTKCILIVISYYPWEMTMVTIGDAVTNGSTPFRQTRRVSQNLEAVV